LVTVAEIITVERRRRWSEEDKRRIVGEALAPDSSVSAVAKRYGLRPSQLFSWRRRLRDGAVQPRGSGGFTSVLIGDPAERPPRLSAPPRDDGNRGRIEIVLGRGRRIVVGSDVDADALCRVLDVLERR
jgi:transposase